MKAMFTYLFWPNLGTAGYSSPKVLAALLLCSALLLLSFAVSVWRRRENRNPVTKRLSKGWPAAMRWLSGIGVILAISRAEGIQFFSMRILWVLLALGILAYLGIQVWKFRLKHYTVIPKEYSEDPREKYLPGR